MDGFKVYVDFDGTGWDMLEDMKNIQDIMKHLSIRDLTGLKVVLSLGKWRETGQ